MDTERELYIFATKILFRFQKIMTLIYFIVGIAIIHAIFLLYPVYRDEALDVYTWTPWTEKEYTLFTADQLATIRHYPKVAARP